MQGEPTPKRISKKKRFLTLGIALGPLAKTLGPFLQAKSLFFIQVLTGKRYLRAQRFKTIYERPPNSFGLQVPMNAMNFHLLKEGVLIGRAMEFKRKKEHYILDPLSS
jgi:hypothetical protein